MTIETYLKQVPLFSKLPDEALSTVVTQGQILTFDQDEIVFWEGDASDSMFVILEGAIRVFKRDEDGNEFDINRQQQGECFGELALLDSQPRSASISCAKPCKMFKLEKAAFMSLLVTPETQSAAFSILSTLVERVRVITEKYFDEQLAQRTLHAEMEAARHRSLAQMVAGVAHELNTPLGITNTAVDMIAKRVANQKFSKISQDDPAVQPLLNQIAEASNLAVRNIARAHSLVEKFKKISVNQLTEHVEVIDFPDLIDDILELFKINARNANLEIVVSNKIPVGQRVWRGYSGYMTQVLTNLLVNVERYAYPDKQGGRVDITLSYDAKAEPPIYTVTVQDYGAGISSENQPQLFEPFFTTGRIKGGTGLGLSIVQNIVTEALNGTIEVESAVGQGTIFYIAFPQTIV